MRSQYLLTFYYREKYYQPNAFGANYDITLLSSYQLDVDAGSQVREGMSNWLLNNLSLREQALQALQHSSEDELLGLGLSVVLSFEYFEAYNETTHYHTFRFLTLEHAARTFMNARGSTTSKGSPATNLLMGLLNTITSNDLRARE